MTEQNEDREIYFIVPVLVMTDVNKLPAIVTMFVDMNPDSYPIIEHEYKVTIYKEGDLYVAECKQLNLVIRGTNKEELIDFINEEIVKYIGYAIGLMLYGIKDSQNYQDYKFPPYLS